MASPLGSGTLPPSRPSSSQASGSDSQSENSAARVRVFRGYKRNIVKDTKLAKTKSKPENTPARTSFSFQYSARSAANGSVSATNTSRVAQVSGINTASYLHYLERKIKLILRLLDSFCHELQIAVSRLCCKVDSRTDKLVKRIAIMRDKADTTGAEDKKVEKDLDWLNAKKVAYAADLKRRMDELRANTTSQGLGLKRHLELLNAKVLPFAEKLKPQLKLLDSKIDSQTRELTEKIMRLIDRYSKFSVTFDVAF